jgi:hypothetical protein
VIIEDARGDLQARRPWWFGPATAAVLVGATIGIVLSEPPPSSAPAVLLRASIEKFSRLTSYHKVGVASYLDPITGWRRTRQITVDVERPGKTRIVWDSDVPLQSTEFLQVEDRRYERWPLGGWFENVSRPASQSGLESPRSPLGEPWVVGGQPAALREIDQPRIDGQATRHIRYAATPTMLADSVLAPIGIATRGASTSGLDLKPTVEVWIRSTDNLIVRVRYALIVGTADEYSFQESYSLQDAPRTPIVAPVSAIVRAAATPAMVVSAYLAATSAGNELAALEVWHVSVAMTAQDRERRTAATHELASLRVGGNYTSRVATYAVPGGPAVGEVDARWAWLAVAAIDAAGTEHKLSFVALVSDFPMLSSTPTGPGNTWTLYDVVRGNGECGMFVC